MTTQHPAVARPLALPGSLDFWLPPELSSVAGFPLIRKSGSKAHVIVSSQTHFLGRVHMGYEKTWGLDQSPNARIHSQLCLKD